MDFLFAVSSIFLDEISFLTALNMIIISYSFSFSMLLIKYINTIYYVSVFFIVSIYGIITFIGSLIKMIYFSLECHFYPMSIVYLISSILYSVLITQIIHKHGALETFSCYYFSLFLLFLIKDIICEFKKFYSLIHFFLLFQ